MLAHDFSLPVPAGATFRAGLQRFHRSGPRRKTRSPCDFSSGLYVLQCMPFVRRFVPWTVLLCLPLLVSCSTSSSTSVAPVASQWVVAWGASPQNALGSATNPGGTEQSFRMLILPTVAATQERVHFSNYFGKSALTIGAARLSLAGAGTSAAIDATQDAALTFSGVSSVTLQPGQEIDSDPAKITYTFGQWLAVSMYLEGTFPALTQHNSQVSNNYATAGGTGNMTTDTTGAAFTQTNMEWFLVTSVDAYGPYAGTVAFFGSSSVDGHNSNIGDTNSYPVPNVVVPTQTSDRPTDWLARSLNTAGYNVGVLNAGLLGDPAGEDASTAAGNVLAGIDRFQHDVVQQPGIKAVVVYTGGIDLRGDCVAATAVEGSLTNIIAQANAAGIRVILATLPPSEYCLSSGPQPTADNPYNGDLYPGPENSGSTQRRALNTWIKTSGVLLPGVVAIADFDQAMAYPAHPDFFLPNLYSTDNFHPNGFGYGVQNGAIPLTSILGQ